MITKLYSATDAVLLAATLFASYNAALSIGSTTVQPERIGMNSIIANKRNMVVSSRKYT